MANLAAGTQAGGLCAQRVCNPLVHGISQAYLFLQRSATSLGAAARVLNVPRFLRLPVVGFFFREYMR
jgi:hypothetical protein